MLMIVPFFALATLWATFSKIWVIFSNLLVTLVGSTLPSNNRLGCEGFQGTHSSFHVHCITDTGENVL